MRCEDYTCVFGSDVFGIRKVAEEAMLFIYGAIPKIRGDAAIETRLILNEALINAVKHGNELDENKKASLQIKIETANTVVIQITDEGQGFDHRRLRKDLETMETVLREDGRGMKLIYALSDKTTHNRRGNEITIYKKVIFD